VAKRRLGARKNIRFHLAGSHDIPLADDSQDFGYSLGVLHHIPDTAAAMRDCVTKLKTGAPFLVYLYFAFDNKPAWYRTLWKASEVGRRTISRLPFPMKKALTTAIAGVVYWPAARLARLAETVGMNVSNLPLSAYRSSSFYTMRTDALDRFGTRLEHRFSRAEIELMMKSAGLTDVRFRDDVPYWVAAGRRES
jgi:SAM-dependent methyltransferase